MHPLVSVLPDSSRDGGWPTWILCDDPPDQGPPSLEELFEIAEAHGYVDPHRPPTIFYSPSGLGAIDNWPLDTNTCTWCFIKAEYCFYELVPDHIRDLYETQKSINEAIDMFHQRLLAHWPAYLGMEYMDSDNDWEEPERDGPNLVQTVPSTPEPSEGGEGPIEDGKDYTRLFDEFLDSMAVREEEDAHQRPESSTEHISRFGYGRLGDAEIASSTCLFIQTDT
ncbi:hypothetical protein V8C35DRAFT_333789 [Trichoderma chlorosporum]